MSENCSNSNDFHKYCDDKGPTLTIVKTTKNKIFGGFTPLNWNNKWGGIKDEFNQTFIFSLNLMKKYDMIDRIKDAIYCDNHDPHFGPADFKLNDNLKTGVTKYCNFLSNNNLELIEGKGDHEDFEVEELEIFKVIY